MTVRINLPFPPSVSHYYRQYAGRRIMSKRGREYRREVLDTLYLYGWINMKGRLSVQVTLNPPDRRKRDIDNYMKSLLDAVTHAGVWEDDSQIDHLSITRGAVGKPGSAELIIKEVE